MLSTHFKSAKHLAKQQSMGKNDHMLELAPALRAFFTVPANIQGTCRLKCAAFMVDHPTVRLNTAQDLMAFASRVFQPLESIIGEAIAQVTASDRLARQNVPALFSLQRAFTAISDTSLNSNSLKDVC